MAGSASAIFAGVQIAISRRHARTGFEDALTAEYRRLVAEMPVEALLRRGITSAKVQEHLGVFYRYFDLCNEQAFLASEGRVRSATWEEWKDGIASNMHRPAFREAWFGHIAEEAVRLDVADHPVYDFNELRELLAELNVRPKVTPE